jgi:hypothetical protein
MSIESQESKVDIQKLALIGGATCCTLGLGYVVYNQLFNNEQSSGDLQSPALLTTVPAPAPAPAPEEGIFTMQPRSPVSEPD